MIKKLLLVLAAVVGLYGSWTAFKEGYIGIKNDKINLVYEVPAYEDVKNDKENLDSKLSELQRLASTGISNAKSGVEREKSAYEAARRAYEKKAGEATAEEIAEANKIEKYLLDYLWIRVGNYANDNDIKFKMTPVEGTNEKSASLDFDITGSYISVINFIYDIQNDAELNFDLDGIVIQGGSSDKLVKAKFSVENINVVTSPDEEVIEGGV